MFPSKGESPVDESRGGGHWPNGTTIFCLRFARHILMGENFFALAVSI